MSGRRLGERFELLAELGRGAMGVVYRARDLTSRREVALKLVQCPGDPARLARFRREAELTAALDHPGIVGVHSAGELDGAAFIAYELVEGARTLDALFEPGLEAGARVRLVRDAAWAVAHAHARGVLHRDLKPANILVDASGRVRVADFGLATATHLERLTRTGAIVGTPTHMAPEQITGAAVGAAADVWALGVTLYQALTGLVPFEATSLVDLAARVCTQRPTPPRAIAPEVPPALEAVCLRALAQSPAARYGDAGELARALDLALASPRGARRGPFTLAAAAGVGVAALVGALALAPAIEVVEAPAVAAPVASTSTTDAALAPPLADALAALERTIGAEARALRAALEGARGPGPLTREARTALERLLIDGGHPAGPVRGAARALRDGPGVPGATAAALYRLALRRDDEGEPSRCESLLRLADGLAPPPPEVAPRVVARWLAAAEAARGAVVGSVLASEALRGEPGAPERAAAVLELLALAQRADPERDLLGEPACGVRVALPEVARNMHLGRGPVRRAARATSDLLLARAPDDPAVCFVGALARAPRSPEGLSLLERGLELVVRAREGAGPAWRELHSELVDQLRARLVAAGELDRARALVDREAARPGVGGQLWLMAADVHLTAGERALRAGDVDAASREAVVAAQVLDALDDVTRDRFAEWVRGVSARRVRLAADARRSESPR